MNIRDFFINLINTNKRKDFFSHVTSHAGNYVIREHKKHYEMIFEDGSVTKLPKNLFSFQKRFTALFE
ncbi:hypothetical protein [Sulfuricurvum sp.]|uniref:hypothetical protein n=1 Tax=Sulfuricurvum sp. TaxID=2025608 RepID=UPI002606FDA9|nr:hypothetical protein [Sulfuricurvum sp.]MDD3597231.1 hypothetical protein [Sulfuricurvum sp.]